MPYSTKSMHVVKQANGIYRWTSTSSNNLQDRDGETISLKALQADVARTKMFGDDDSLLYFYHVRYPIGGAPDYRALVGGMLVETGEFYDRPVAKAVAEYCMSHPDGLDGSGWGTSIGFMGVPDHSGTYHSMLISERSVLSLSKAANAYTNFGVREKMAITPDQQKALDMVLDTPELIGVVKQAIDAQDQSKMAGAAGIVRKAKTDTPAVPVLKPGNNEAKPVTTPQTATGFTAKAADTPVEQPAEDEKPEEKPAEEEKPEEKPADQQKAATGGLTDADLAGIAQFVQDTVQKAVKEAVTAMTAEITKMRQTFATETQAKMLNEVPRSTFERLKALGTTPAAAVAAEDPAYVEKGKNLPAAPDNPVARLMTTLGFGSQE